LANIQAKKRKTNKQKPVSVTKSLIGFRMGRSRECELIYLEIKWRGENNFLKNGGKTHSLPPHLPFFIIDTSLLFDLCVPLFWLPGAQGKWLAVSSLASQAQLSSAASPSGSASWITPN
jgi:hypothetical protein